MGIKKTIITSTCGVFGPSIDGIVNENTIREIDFFNDYESSKAMAESSIKKYVTKHNMNIVIVNPTRIYGPYLLGESASITLMLEKYIKGNWKFIPGNGEQIGNYVFIEDVINGHLKAMEKGQSGENYILGGYNHSYNEFFDVIKKKSGKNHKTYFTPLWVQMMYGRIQLFKAKFLNIKPTITPKWIIRGNYNWKVSSDKAVSELGLSLTSLEDGITTTIKEIDLALVERL